MLRIMECGDEDKCTLIIPQVCIQVGSGKDKLTLSHVGDICVEIWALFKKKIFSVDTSGVVDSVNIFV
jgi:hypothetical protein